MSDIDVDRQELDALTTAAREAADGDSNDEEIQALQEALDFALVLLRRVGVPVRRYEDNHQTYDDGTCTDECVDTHPDHQEMRNDDGDVLTLVWTDAGNDEPGDQNADTELDEHGYWSLGPDGTNGEWAVELIKRDVYLTETGSVQLGRFPSEEAAKAAAALYEFSQAERERLE